MKIGDRIKELRTNIGLTQYNLSDKADISRSVLSQYESNLVEPTATVIYKLALALNTSSDYLLGLEDDFGVRLPADSLTDGLTTEERGIIEDYRTLNPECKKLIKQTLQTLKGTTAPAQSKSNNIS